MHGLFESLRYTIRVLLKAPGFTITAILVLGLGIGATSGVRNLGSSTGIAIVDHKIVDDCVEGGQDGATSF